MSRDFSVEGSLAAGLQVAQGDAALILFSDLQDPTNRIPDFLARWEQGHEVVYGVLESRTDEPAWKSWGAHAIYRFLGKFASVEIPPNATDFRLLSRRAIDVLNQCPERLRYLRGLSHWIGFRSCALQSQRRPREAGSSKASLQVMFQLAGNALTGFSLAPLRALTFVGVAVAAVTVMLTCFTILGRVAGWSAGPGLTEILLLAQLAATFLCAGILGEDVGRAYWETKQRPLFGNQSTWNIHSSNTKKEAASKSPLALFETFPANPELRNRTDTQEHCHAA